MSLLVGEDGDLDAEIATCRVLPKGPGDLQPVDPPIAPSSQPAWGWLSRWEPINSFGPLAGLVDMILPMPSISAVSPASCSRSTSHRRASTSCRE